MGSNKFFHRRPSRCLATVLVCLTLSGSVGSGLASASAAPSEVHPNTGCDVVSVEDPIINIPPFTYTADEECGIKAIENDAYDLYAFSHGMDPGDPRIVAVGQDEVAGIAWALLQQIVHAHANDPTVLTVDEQGAYDWLQQIVSGTQLLAAQDAQAEYTRWLSSPCTYVPPNLHLFTFRGSTDPACSGSFGSVFQGVAPPSYQELIEMGLYDADQSLGLNTALGGSTYQQLTNERIGEAQATWGALLLGAVPQALNVTGQFGTLLESLAQTIHPGVRRAAIRINARNNKAVDDEDEDLDSLEEEERGLSDPDELPEIEGPADDALEELVDGGFDVGESVADFGASTLSGPFIVAGFAAAVLVQEALKISDELKLPQQLQDNVTAATESVDDLINLPTAGGSQTALSDFESQLSLPSPTVGIPSNVLNSSPDDGSKFEVEQADASGAVHTTALQTSVSIATWPLGIDQGVHGVQTAPITYFNGQSYKQIQAGSDDALAGLSGYVPSGEMRYFDWSGRPRTAMIDGDKFLDVSGPGTADLGGQDEGDDCDTGSGTDCSVTSEIDVLGSGAKVDPSYSSTAFTNGGFNQVQLVHPSDGTIEVSPNDIRYKLLLKPDIGTPATQNINNQFGKTANQGTNLTSQDGGLFAGDTVAMTDPITSPLGFSTTYKWEIETRCPYDPTHPVHTVDGVPECFGSADYNAAHLPANEQDIASCNLNRVTCTEDAAFHGNSVKVVTGQSVPFTWPVAGTYHVRLITNDQFNHTVTSDQNKTVLGRTPSVSSLTSTVGSAGLSVFGPVQNGQSMSITGCINSASGAYDNPHVSLDWGDGTTDTASGQDVSFTSLVFTHNPSGCSGSAWSFTDTHTYNLTSSVFQEQKALHLTVGDGEGDSTSLSPFVNVQFSSAPGFTSANTTTFYAGTIGSFTVAAPSSPDPTLSFTGSLPVGIGFTNNGDGTATITGDPSITEGGSYPITIQATNGSGPSEGTVNQTFTLQVDVAPTFISSTSLTVPTGHATEVDFSATGTPAPAVAITGDTVPGMTVVNSSSSAPTGSTTAKLIGTPTTQGIYHLTITSANDAGKTVQSFILDVGSAPAFTSPTTAGFITNSASSFVVAATGSPAPALSITSGSLPSGLLFADLGNGTAEIFGKPTGITSSGVTITATSSAGQATQNLTVNASATGGPTVSVTGTNVTHQTLDVTSGALLYTSSLQVGTNGPSVTVTSSDTTASLTESGSLPSGVTFHDNGNGTGTFNGTPSTGSGGYFAAEVTAHPSSGPTGLAFVQFDVYGPPTLTSSPTAFFTANSAGAFTITANGIAIPRYTLVGTLPTGLSFNDPGNGTATISGTPTGTPGSSMVTIQSESIQNFGSPISTTLTIEVDSAPAITSSSTVHLSEGVVNTFTVTTSGYPLATLSELGTLPPGVTFTDNGGGTGTLSGTPTDTSVLSYPVTVQASSKVGTVTQSMTIDVGPGPTITATDSGIFLVGSNTATFTFSSDTTPTPSWSATGLPGGVTLTDNHDGTGSLLGMPNVGTGGINTVQLMATNTYGSTTKTLTFVVDEAPSYRGMDFGSCNAPTLSLTAVNLQVGDSGGTTTPCALGYPAPAMSLSGPLPNGVTFTDNGDGSASITGGPDSGTGGLSSVVLSITNAAGTATQTLSVEVDEQANPTGDVEATWVAGQANTFTINSVGYPAVDVASDTTSNSLPVWLTFTDNSDGTATLTGTPPTSLLSDPNNLSTEVDFDLNQSVGSSGGGSIEIDVAPLAFTSESPPSPTIGVPYSYQFAATDPSATFTVTNGAALPDGLSLSSSGLFSGTPTTVASWPFSVSATNSNGSVQSDPIVLAVQGTTHQLEISAFRLFGPAGRGDWYVTLRNTSGVTMQLYGWKVGIFVPGISTPILESLQGVTLAANTETTIGGPYFSLVPNISLSVVGPSTPSNPGGFEVLSPDGTVADKAGQVGAPAGAIAGTGVAIPTGAGIGAQSAYVRHFSAGALIDSGNNASDFTYLSVLFTPGVLNFTSTSSGFLNSTYSPSVTSGGASSPITFTIDPSSTSGSCSVSGSIVNFAALGTCVVTAHQLGDIRYIDALPVSQSIAVVAAPVSGGGAGGTAGVTGTSGTSGTPTTTPVTTTTPTTPVTTPTGPVVPPITVSNPVSPGKDTTVTVGTGTGQVVVVVPAGAVSSAGTIKATTSVPATVKGDSFAVGSEAIQIAITSNKGKTITAFNNPVELTFPKAPASFLPAYSHGGAWTEIPQITKPTKLPAGWPDGWYRDSKGVHVLTRHATYFALLAKGSKETQALQLTSSVPSSLNLDAGNTVTLRLKSTFPSTTTITLAHGKKKLASWTQAVTSKTLSRTVTLPKAARSVGVDQLTISDKGIKETSTKMVQLKLVKKPVKQH